MTTITVVMPSVPLAERAGVFAEAKASVLAQTRLPDQFLIAHDPQHSGAGVAMNRALPKVTSEWIAQLGDDDYFLPWHLETLETAIDQAGVYAQLEPGAPLPDVLYPDCRTLGVYSGALGGEFDVERLKRGNFIPGGGSLVRTAALREVGGWCTPGDPDYHRYEDWVLWLRLALSGHAFLHVPVVTWVYRFWNGSTGGRIG